MATTTEKNSCISSIINCIETILKNIKELEKVKLDGRDCDKHVDRLKQQIGELLVKVETEPLEQLSKVLKKKKLKRNRKKYKLKQMKAEAKKGIILQDLKSDSYSKISQNKICSNPSFFGEVSSIIKYQHDRLMKQHDAQRLLRTFELLKMLHFSRGQKADLTKEFCEQLSDLRVYWRKILEENKQECTQERQVEDQWNDIFFGSAEHSYYNSEQNINELLRVRRIWDSYLTRSKHGSSIPCGWIFPNDSAVLGWQQYRSM